MSQKCALLLKMLSEKLEYLKDGKIIQTSQLCYPQLTEVSRGLHGMTHM